MLASYPASMVNQKHTDLGIPNRFNLTPSRFSVARASGIKAELLPCQPGGHLPAPLTLVLRPTRKRRDIRILIVARGVE